MADNDEMRRLMTIIESFQSNDFEKIAFGDLKKSGEADTEFEADVFDALRNFIQMSNPSNKADADAILKDVHVLKAKYPNELVPDSKFAFRGTQLQSAKYREFLEYYSSDELANMDQFDLMHVADIMYTPRSPIQSWTTRESIAVQFAAAGDLAAGYKWESQFPYPAVLEAKVDSTFIMSTDITNQIADLNNIAHENEIIRTAGQPISCKVHVTADWLINARKWQGS
jgi:hypothetical protein